MSLWRLAWQLLAARPVAHLLALLLVAMGWAAVSFVLLISLQLDERVRKDLAGIDLVVGAKGSPLQILLAGVFHVDAPTGNIPLATVQTLRAHPLVAEVIPLSLGDSVQGWRIVGSEPAYQRLYGATLAQGRAVQSPSEVVLGAEVARATGLGLGDRVTGSHGLSGGGEAHGQHPFTVVGVLARSGSVLDRLVLTSLEAVWTVHEAMHEVDAEDRAILEAEREVTLLLVRYRSPLAAAMLPRWVNGQDGLQSASPALESARLLRMLGAGRELLQGFGALLLLSSLLSLFITQLQMVRERQGDLALLRLMGAPPWRLAALVALQALMLVTAALVMGVLAAHAAQAGLATWLAGRQSVALDAGYFSAMEFALLPLAWALALLAAAGPAWRALRTDVAVLLQAPR